MFRTINNIKRIVLFVIIFGSTITIASASSANEWVQYLEGTWVGTGTGKTGPGEAEQTIKCRFRGNAESDSRVSFAGRCASTKKRGNISMTLIAKSSSTFRGFANSIFSQRKLTYTGRSSDGSLSITASQPVEAEEGGRFASQITIKQVGTDGLSFVEQLRNLDTGVQFTSVSIQYKRR